MPTQQTNKKVLERIGWFRPQLALLEREGRALSLHYALFFGSQCLLLCYPHLFI